MTFPYPFGMQSKGSVAKGLLICMIVALVPLSSYSTIATGLETPSCGNYKLRTNEVIAGVKFPKGTYQINSFGISCTKVMGAKGLFAKFLKLKDKEPLPKPWSYLADSVGAPKFSSRPGVGFRAQLVTAIPTPNPIPTISSTQIIGPPQQLLSYENMKNAMVPKPVGNLFRFHYSPNAVQSFKDYLELELNYSMTYWTIVYDPREPFNVFYGTEKDLDWLINAWKPYGFDKNTGFANDFRGRIEREGTRLNAGAVPSQLDSSHLSILRHSTQPTEPGSFIPHENVHIVQQQLTKNNTYRMPCWLREGSANLFGNFLVAEKYGISTYNRAKWGDMNNFLWGSSGVDLRKFNKEDWFTHLKSLEGNFSGGCDYLFRFAYGTGLLLSELLMADRGFEKMMEFWRAFSRDTDWRESFKAIYKEDLESWYREKAIPYLMSEYSRVGP